MGVCVDFARELTRLNLAFIETGRQRYVDALAFAPLHVTGLAARALALKQLDRLGEAFDAASRALASRSSPHIQISMAPGS
jgi:hypothetical protein